MIIGLIALSIFGYMLLIAAMNDTFRREEDPEDENEQKRNRTDKKV